MGPYEERTERRWFTRDLRDATHRAVDETEARWLFGNNSNVVAVLYRDVTYGPMVEVARRGGKT